MIKRGLLAMLIESALGWLDVSLKIAAILSISIGGLWAWSKYIIERGLIPPVDFSIDYNIVGTNPQKHLIEILLLLKNLGNSTLVAKDVKLRVKYLNQNDEIDVFRCNEDVKFGRVNFSNPLSKDFSCAEKSESKISKFTILKYSSIVQPGVKQIYSFVTALPSDVVYILLRGEFKYAQKPKILQKVILFISRRLGLINWSLHHISKPHTIERCFRIPEESHKEPSNTPLEQMS
jgi:hypothetical protein